MNNMLIEDNKQDSYMHIFFSVNDVMYSVPVYCVVEVLPFCQLQAPQKLQKYTIGLLDYNGLMINVIDLRKLFGFTAKEFSVNQKFIILKTEDSIFAIVADEVNNIYDINAAVLQIAPHSSKNFIQSIYNKTGVPVSVINIPAIEEEIKKADLCEDEVFNLPVLSKSDEIIAQKRAEKIKLKSNNYEAVKYFEYIKYLTFDCDNSKFCIDITYIEKVLEVSPALITQIPNETNYLEGVINFRGTFLTVINFGKILDLNSQASEDYNNKRIIVISVNDFKVGLFVDKIFEISNISKDDLIDSNDFSSICPFIHHQVIKNDDIYFIIDVEDLLRDDRMYINE